MSRKRSYVEAMENGAFEHFLNQNSINVTRNETVHGSNDSDSVDEVFLENDSEVNLTSTCDSDDEVFLENNSQISVCDEVSLNNECYNIETIHVINECKPEIAIPEECCNRECIDENSEFIQDSISSQLTIDETINISFVNDTLSEDLNSPKKLHDIDSSPVVENIEKSENSLVKNQAEKKDNFEMSSIKDIDGSSASSEVMDDDNIQFRRDVYLDSNGRLFHATELEKMDDYANNDYSEVVENIADNDEYVASNSIERFSNNFVNESQFENGIFSEANNMFANDRTRYDLIEVDQEIADNTNTNTSSFQNNTTSDEKDVFPIQYTGRNSVRKSKRKYPQNQGFRAQKWRRVIFRNGDANTPLRLHLPRRAGKYMKDIVTTLVDGQWRWLIFLLSVCHFIIWLGFGLMFYVASYANGDMSSKPPEIPCITEGRTFTGIFTFAVETQVSIGYGEKSPTEACPEVIFILVMEVVAGYLLLGAMVGIVYTKIMRPAKHLKGVGFSKNAVVCLRDGHLCLVVRVWDNKQRHVMSTRVSGWLIKHTPSGLENYPLNMTPGVMILWPVTLQHVIDKDSPLFNMSAKDLLDTRFEIVIVVVGACRLTGNTTQSRTSYLPHDVLWGHRFKRVLNYSPTAKSYVVDTKALNSLESVDTPLCSARLLYELNSGLINGSPRVSISPLFLSPPGSPPGSPLSIAAIPGLNFQHIPKLVRERSV